MSQPPKLTDMAAGLLFFMGLLVWALWSRLRAGKLVRGAQRACGERPVRYRSSGVGRVALKGYRAYGDVRALARGGPGADKPAGASAVGVQGTEAAVT